MIEESWKKANKFFVDKDCSINPDSSFGELPCRFLNNWDRWCEVGFEEYSRGLDYVL